MSDPLTLALIASIRRLQRQECVERSANAILAGRRGERRYHFLFLNTSSLDRLRSPVEDLGIPFILQALGGAARTHNQCIVVEAVQDRITTTTKRKDLPRRHVAEFCLMQRNEVWAVGSLALAELHGVVILVVGRPAAPGLGGLNASAVSGSCSG